MITATIAHAPVLAALHGAVFPEEPWDEAAFASLLAQPGMFGLLDPRGGFVLLRVAADEAEIITIGVVAKRQGIGKTLLASALSQARTEGARTVFLEVAAANQAAQALYGKFGFTRTGLRQNYYIHGGDAAVMALNLCEWSAASSRPAAD